jgi:hypothetical protein
MANRRRNKLVVPGVENFMDRFKNEIAAELGIANYDEIDKGALPARVHGMIGGTMTKRLIEMGELYLSQQNPSQSNLNPQQYVQEMQDEISRTADEAYQNAKVVPTPNNIH